MKLNITIPERFRIGLLPAILLVLAGNAFVIAMIRFADGIGPVSNLSNSYPWGFWISFDLFTGVAIGSVYSYFRDKKSPEYGEQQQRNHNVE